MSPPRSLAACGFLDVLAVKSLALRAVQTRAGGFEVGAINSKVAAAPAAWRPPFCGPFLDSGFFHAHRHRVV